MDPTPTRPRGSIARGDVHYRRRTVSGTQPSLPKAPKDGSTGVEKASAVASSPAPTPPSVKVSSGSNRTFSGNILARFTFRRNTGDINTPRPPSREQRPASREKEPASPTKSVFGGKSSDDDVAVTDSPPTVPSTGEREGALSAALQQSNKTRKRTGSLRKTAILGGRRNVTEERIKKGGPALSQRNGSEVKVRTEGMAYEHLGHEQRQKVSILYREAHDGDQSTATDEGASSRPQNLRRQFSYENAAGSGTNDSHRSESAAVSQTRLSLLTDHQVQTVRATSSRAAGGTMVDDLGSPLDMKSPTSQISYTSTTSDDDFLTFPPPKPIPPLSTTSTSYFPSVDSLPSTSSTTSLQRRKSKPHRSPLSRTLTLNATPSNPSLYDSGHDYSSTETWGWLLLLTTWLTFTVGMGSSLEIWSWAWDVGDTPYAPPELEDDPTLPIVGYYPALMVLTGVVAWVWVTVAWVGMKYFRHAKIEV